MRKSLLLIAAALVVLCFTQCTKQRPSNPYMGKKTGNITFTASPSGGDSRNHFTDPMNGGLNFTWEADDELYVYCSHSGNFENDGYYSGKIGIVSGVGEVGAKFSGTVPYDNIAGAKLRFFYFGNDVSIVGDVDKPNSNVSATADFSIQDRKSEKETDTNNKETVSDKLIAMLECSVNTSISSMGDYGGELKVQFAIIKLTFQGFSGDLTVNGMAKKKVHVNEHGVVSYFDGENASVKYTGIQYDSNPDNPSGSFYGVFVREYESTPDKVSYSFEDSDSNIGSLVGAPEREYFYTYNATGAAYKIIAGNEELIINSGQDQHEGR